jgi:RNA polymerase sigma factor (sigma-70 family)
MATASLQAVVGFARRVADCDVRRRTDRQLLELFDRQRDEAAFAELVRRHGPMVLAACRRVLRNHHDAEDSFQATFLVLARKAGSIRDRECIGGWLYQVAFRIALRARATASRRREDALLPKVCAMSHGEPFAIGLSACLDEELDRLPEHYRSALVLCYLEGRTQLEAARQLATTAQGINSRLKRARDLLRQRLVRCGLALGSIGIAEMLSQAAVDAGVSAALRGATVRAALNFVSCSAGASGASAGAAALAKGVLLQMVLTKIKLAAVCVAAVAFLAGLLLIGSPLAQGENPRAPAGLVGAAAPRSQKKDSPTPVDKAKPQASVIILWMSGGPSQIDTFDPKPGHPNGVLSQALDTNVKGLQICSGLPQLAKLANHLTIFRTVTHREGDHSRGTYLMYTGRSPDGLIDYPSLGSVLAKELGDKRPDVPRYISFGTQFVAVPDPGILGPQYAPLLVGGKGGFGAQPIELPPVDAFEKLAKGKGETHRNAVAPAFDLAKEKDEVREAYGRNPFGEGCLLARRLVERGVPVVQVSMGGWDMHANIPGILPRRAFELDAAWSSLLKDLNASKRLDKTLIVWMGEFGRTPVINANAGRDHWPMCFSVVLAGGATKGGQAIGKTSFDGARVEERPVTVPELHATIYRAIGIDPTKENHRSGEFRVPLVEKGAEPVKEALR